MGGAVIAPPVAALGDPAVFQRVIQVSGDDSLGMMLSASIDAIGAIDLQQIASITEPNRAVARIKWGVEGRMHVALVDIKSGTVISVPGASLEVEVGNEDVAMVAGAGLLIGASAAYLPRGSAHRPTRTVYNDAGVPGAGGNFDFRMVAYAANVTYLRTPNTTPYTMQFMDFALVVQYDIAVVAGADAPINIPLGNGITRIRVVTAPAGPAITRSQMIFGLAI